MLLPRVLGQWHSGKRGFYKQQTIFFPECLGHALGEEDFFKKNETSSPSVALGEEFF
jgi:hypothetical protein